MRGNYCSRVTLEAAPYIFGRNFIPTATTDINSPAGAPSSHRGLPPPSPAGTLAFPFHHPCPILLDTHSSTPGLPQAFSSAASFASVYEGPSAPRPVTRAALMPLSELSALAYALTHGKGSHDCHKVRGEDIERLPGCPVSCLWQVWGSKQPVGAIRSLYAFFLDLMDPLVPIADLTILNTCATLLSVSTTTIPLPLEPGHCLPKGEPVPGSAFTI